MIAPPRDAFVDILRRHLKYLEAGEEVDFDAELRPLGLDSMAALNLLFDLEDAFDVMLPDEYLVDRTFATANALYTAITTVATAA